MYQDRFPSEVAIGEKQKNPVKDGSGQYTRGRQATQIQVAEGGARLLENLSQESPNNRKIKRQLKNLRGKLNSLSQEEAELVVSSCS